MLSLATDPADVEYSNNARTFELVFNNLYFAQKFLRKFFLLNDS